jgi:predicted phosphodiesterase
VRYLILSDIHANLEALEAVSERAAGAYDQVICLGDIVGYGADPNAAVEWTRTNGTVTIRGNHDKAGAGLEDLEWFNEAARQSALWTQAVLSEPNLAWLRELPMGPADVDGFQIFHGSPVDEDEYLLQLGEIRQLAGCLLNTISFFGHTHVQGGFFMARGAVRRLPGVPKKHEFLELRLDDDGFYLINPGSVGQPRDLDPRAAFAIYDSNERLVTFHRVRYEVALAQYKIEAAGLPRILSSRLSLGR